MASETEVVYFRGDSYPKRFTLTDSVTGEPIPLTGYNVVLVCASVKNPVDDTTKLFSVSCVIVDADAGEITMRPTRTDTDQDPTKKYYYDIQLTMASDIEYRRTVLKDKFIITQDLNKT